MAEIKAQSTVLVVNGLPELLELMRLLLDKSGYRVLTAVDGRQGFEMAQAEQPDLIISDVAMPRMDGIEMCREIRADASLHQTPVLLVSAKHDDRESAVEGLKAGADDYLEAPYDPMRLIAKVAQLAERRRSEEALKESEERYRRLVELSPEAIIIHCDGRLVFVNTAGAKLTGAESPEELLGRPVMDFVHPDFHEFVGQRVSRVLKGVAVPAAEEKYIRLDGSIIDVEIAAIPFSYKGRPAVQCIVRDITERKLAAVELRKSEERYRDLVENARDIIYTHDLEGNFTSINKVGEQITGYTREEVLKMNLADAVVPEHLENARRMISGRIASEEETVNDLDIIARDGRRISFEVNTRFVYQDGQPVGVQGIARDVTERKRSREMLWEADRRAVEEYERLLDRLASLALSFGTARDLLTIYRGLCEFSLSLTPSFALAICSYDEVQKMRQGVYINLNGAELEPATIGAVPLHSGPVHRAIKAKSAVIYNDYLKELIGRNSIYIGFDEDREKPLSALIAPMMIQGRIIGTLEVQSHELAAYTREHATAMQMAANLAANAIENVRLLNLEHDKEEQLRQSQKMEAVGKLAGGIAHDFNNLLTAINGYSELTMRRMRAEDPLRQHIVEIKKAGDRAASLTRQLLAFSRKQVLQPRVLDLNSIISDLEKMLGRLIGEDIGLRVALTPQLGNVKADPGQIEQVLMNLVVNARDAMPQGGKLTIETGHIYLDENYAGQHIAVAPGPYAMLAVSDTGTGMDEQTRQRIFEPFFTTKEAGKGTGLGLSTVYGIVKQSGGNIWVYSEVGVGTTFKIYLPRVDEGAQDYKRGVESEKALQGTETILLTEDDERVRKLASEVLGLYGYRVLEAAHGKAALLIYKGYTEPVDLLITDVIMPEMSGRELADRLSQLQPRIKVLYMSGYTDNAIVHQGVLDADTNFIQKPFSPEALARKVREVLRGAK